MDAKKLIQRNYPNTGLAFLRLAFGVMLAWAHGWPTLKGLFAGVTDYPDPLGIGSHTTMALMGITEFFFALLVVLGLFTRLSLLPLIFGFTVAFFVFHGNDPFAVKEQALHYLIVFVVLFIAGPGDFTLKDLLKTKSK